MRQIKFRIWNSLTKNFECSNGQLLSQIMCFQNGELTCAPHFIIQQYTGLKDINGEEIYEGDILKQISWYDRTYIVKFGKFLEDSEDIPFEGNGFFLYSIEDSKDYSVLSYDDFEKIDFEKN